MGMNLTATAPETTRDAVVAALGDKARRVELKLGEVTVVVTPQNYLEAARILKEAPGCQFEQLLDLCGVDYSEYKAGEWDGARYAVTSHLLSVSLNQRVRLRVFAPDDELPVVESLTGLWNSANWFEREAFDLYGIVFEGHADLRRLLTDYGFIGHPFRKDFPLIGNVEMRYDPAKGRVVYEPVSIEPRTLVPKVIRDDARYEPDLKAKDPGNA
jgi:NADH-quinone oxidoreductase subunit C